jgi:transposase
VPFPDAIELGLSQGRNATCIWQDLVSESGFRGGYQTVKRFVRKLRGTQRAQACGVIVTAPGQEAQVDYGQGAMVRDGPGGKYRRTRLFVMTLGCSRVVLQSPHADRGLHGRPRMLRLLNRKGCR